MEVKKMITVLIHKRLLFRIVILTSLFYDLFRDLGEIKINNNCLIMI